MKLRVMGAVWALGFMGAIGLLGAIGQFSQARKARGGIIVPATIVELQTSQMRRVDPATQNFNRIRAFAPVVEFTDEQGQLHRVTSSLSGTRRPAIGSTVSVSYRPGNPDKAIVVGVPGQSGAKWAFLVIGLVCAGAAIAVAIAR